MKDRMVDPVVTKRKKRFEHVARHLETVGIADRDADRAETAMRAHFEQVTSRFWRRKTGDPRK